MTKRDVPALLGIPFDGQSSYLRGARDAPPKIREALRCDASNMWTELGVDLGVAGTYEDAGDLSFSGGERRTHGEENPHPSTSSGQAFSQSQGEVGHPTTSETFTADLFAAIEAGVGALIDSGKCPVSLGGDHSITYPIVKAVAKRYPGLTIFHFDAHPDLYDSFEGNRLSHACPFARIMEAGLAKRLVQVGIRTINGHQREQAGRFGVDVIEMRSLGGFDRLKADGPVYVTFDMDVLDPAFAPGISHREPGGMSVREAIAHLHAIEGAIVGADVVEFNPVRDVDGLTATVAAKIVKELLGKMIAGRVPF
jgi:arginase